MTELERKEWLRGEIERLKESEGNARYRIKAAADASKNASDDLSAIQGRIKEFERQLEGCRQDENREEVMP